MPELAAPDSTPEALIQRTLAPTSGFSSEVYNGASMRVRGFEAVLNAYPLQTPRYGGLTWNTRINFAMNRAIISKLPVSPFLFSAAQVGAVQIREGQSATRLVGNDTVAVAGTCPAHPMEPLDPTFCASRKVGDVVPVYMGDGNPDYTAGLGNEVRWKGLTLYGLFDRQDGGIDTQDDPPLVQEPRPVEAVRQVAHRHVSACDAHLLSGRVVLEAARADPRLRHS